MKGTLAFLALGILASAFARADVPAPVTGVAQFEGTYDRQGPGCAYASQVTFTEDTDATTDLVTYHLLVLREDGRTWNSREYRQLNGQPWYKADFGHDGTISGRSRYVCAGPDCTLSNEHKTCTGVVFPRCSAWTAARPDEVVFEGSALTLFTESEGTCTFVKH